MSESETGSKCEQSFATAVDLGEALLVSQSDSVVALDTGATANLACFSWLAHQNSILEKRGSPRVSTNPSKAKFRSGDGRLGEVRHAADIPVWIAGDKGRYTPFAPGSDIPALLRRGARRRFGGSWIFLRGSLILRRQGVRIPHEGENCRTFYPESG